MSKLVHGASAAVVMLAAGAAGWWLHATYAPGANVVSASYDRRTVLAPTVDAIPQEFRAMTSHHGLSIPPNEIGILKKAALGGSDAAVQRLVTAYEDCASMQAHLKRDETCAPQLYYWAQIARENQALSGANLAFNELQDSSRCEDVFRARFWLNKMLVIIPETPWLEASAELAKQEQRCG